MTMIAGRLVDAMLMVLCIVVEWEKEVEFMRLLIADIVQSSLFIQLVPCNFRLQPVAKFGGIVNQ